MHKTRKPRSLGFDRKITSSRSRMSNLIAAHLIALFFCFFLIVGLFVFYFSARQWNTRVTYCKIWPVDHRLVNSDLIYRLHLTANVRSRAYLFLQVCCNSSLSQSPNASGLTVRSCTAEAALPLAGSMHGRESTERASSRDWGTAEPGLVVQKE